MIKVWIANVTPLLEEECYRAFYEKLPKFRKEKADAITAAHMEKRAQSVGAWSLWTQMKEKYGLPDEAVFNLSHSGSYVMCAAQMDKNCDCHARGNNSADVVRVGCDIEKIGSYRETLAERFFCKNEYETILACKAEEERKKLFYRYWVLKESFIKATREGMKIELDSFEIQLGNPPILIKQPERYPQQYYYREYEIRDVSYKMAVCSTDREIDVIVETELKI